MKVVAVPLL